MSDADEQLTAALALVRANGFVVDRPEYSEWTTPKALWGLIGQRLSYRGFQKRLSLFKGDFPARRGPTGRLIEFRSTPALEKWLNKSKQQGAKML